MVSRKNPSEVLASVHQMRRPDRTVVSLWLEGLSEKDKARWREYLDAFHSMPNINVPDLIEAVRSDEVLGEGFPEISSERLKRWIEKDHAGEEEERKG